VSDAPTRSPPLPYQEPLNFEAWQKTPLHNYGDLTTLALAYISLGREPGREQRLRLKIFGQAAGQR